MKTAAAIRLPTRAWVLLLAILVGLCATDLSGVAMAMADEQPCAGPFCEARIGCSQPMQPQHSPGPAIDLVAPTPSGERLLPPVRIETQPPDLSTVRPSFATFGPSASRAPPVV